MKPLLTGLLLLFLARVPAAPAATPELQEGVDYVRIEAGPLDPRAGRIEVAEVFAYTCPPCASFEPRLQEWKRRLPADVDLVQVPAAFGGASDTWARTYYASRQLGVATRSHPALFEALHQRHSLPRNPTPQELGEFFKDFGVDPERLRAALADPQVGEQVRKAGAWIRTIDLEGTPSLVVNGRYRVRGRDFDDMLRIAGALVARERAAMRSQTSR
ncbi:thiol:disulfide interchange protein DsbA/DsbL [Pseudoxanthomonas sp. GW2]|uniref:thiol:disulfide interchange protein DsbA/DsbL n=1 Tax=Pseudoxanthomonas sp. GW2 TaxID=1211114 RepID=UPI0002F4A011|nr:thiol:disulfide interchange protein DsbA/DsbL [Pseudoxanthomonas sp. GW2]